MELSPYQTLPRTLTPFWPCRHSLGRSDKWILFLCFTVSEQAQKHSQGGQTALVSASTTLNSGEGHTFLPGSFLPQIRSPFHTLKAKNGKLDSEPILPQAAKPEQTTWLLREMFSGMSRSCYSPATAKQTALQPDPSVSDSLHRSSLAISQHTTVP